jgi:NAD-dependent SIR2 family protein deacetylase
VTLPTEPLPSDGIERAADLLGQADALVVGAGAGMGIDSGLPDFRGPGGFWRAYPALGRRGLAFHEVASPHTFDADPALAWGFYGHRLALYRATAPHAGFGILRRLGARLPHGAVVFTSNVDGHFQRAGFDAGSVTECHGSIHHLQCTRPCSDDVWPADDFVPEVDAGTCTLLNAPPRCPHCGALARPAILMFGDGNWVDRRTRLQEARLQRWLADATRIVVIEIGAGTAIPSVRDFSHDLLVHHGARLVRINPAQPAVPTRFDVSLAQPALAALQALAMALEDSG